ncbi:site-specific DNA-methyltransferase [Streptomyces sp. NPDC053728]|uniref:site-specific DNA-methyltransferase n=1 Tax=Streptomyces sp. NPDC053728 TaxID=3155534 RepID=UPI003441626F
MGEGRYDYTFADPRDPRVQEVRLLHEVGRVEAETPENRPTDLPLPTTENLLITGDAMHVLDSLLKTPEWAAKYLGKVKLVYIDPPFNTGQAFDHYEDNIEHSIWLTMLRDRLRQIKPLLTEDGSVWVHLDDVEIHRCRAVMDEQFGSKGFVGTIVWQKRYSRESRPAIGEVHDSILVYAKSVDRFKKVRNKIVRTGAKEYRNPNNDPRGPWRIVPMTAPGTRKNQMYEIAGPDGRTWLPPKGRCWSTVRSGYDELLAQDRIRFGISGDGAPGILRYLDEDEGLTPWTWWPHEEVGHTDEAKKEIQALFGAEDAFDTPKPERLMRRIIEIATDPGDIVLDCFAGSGTTAAVAHKLGRHWVTCDLLSSTVDRFTKPRLTRIVDGKDDGGITCVETRVPTPEGELPEGMSPDQAVTFQRYLNKVLKNVPDADEATVKALKAATKTTKSVTALWHGGGAFTHLEVGSSMYEVDEDGDILLADVAVNGEWSKSVAAQLKFSLTPDHPVFCGIRGRQRLVVIDGVADQVVVETVLEHLGEREKAIIVAKAVLPDAETLLKKSSPGSRIKRAPDDLFSKKTVK